MPRRIEVREGKRLTYIYKILILNLWVGRVFEFCRAGQVRSGEMKTSVAILVGLVSIAAWENIQSLETKG